MIKRIIILLSLAVVTTVHAVAQSVQVNFDKKVIYTDSLNMPVNTTALELLNLLPELLQRPGSLLLSNYETNVQGMSINQGKDVALSSLLIEDIEKIEVQDSPLSSYLNNGASGTINIVLRQHGKNSDKLWGNATLSTSYPTDLAPQLLLSHRTQKFKVHGLLLADIYNSSATTENLKYSNKDVFTGMSHTDINSRYRTQLARSYMQFLPTQKDKVELNLSQTYTYNRNNTTPDYQKDLLQTARSKTTQLHAMATYTHNFTPRTSLVLQGQYIFTPQTLYDFYPMDQLIDRDNKTHTIAGKAEVSTALLPEASMSSVKMVTGSSFNNTTSNQVVSSYYYAYNIPYNGKQEYNTYFAQPYLRFELTAGKLRAKLEGQIQHFKYDLSNAFNQQSTSGTVAKPNETSVTSNDFTGIFVGEYHFTPHKNLRLIAMRSLQRPSASQVNSLPTFDTWYSYYIIGNNTLLPSLSHEVRLDYITDYKWGTEGLTIDASMSYNHISDIIISTVVGQKEALPGINLDCISYENNGHNHITSANLMAQYTNKVTTVSLSSNIYHNNQCVNDVQNHYTYYNLALYGQVRLPSGWQGAAKMAYYSKVKRTSATLSDCAVTTLSIAKAINSHLSSYMFARIAAKDKAMDFTTGANGSYTVRKYNMVTNAVGFGLRYSF